MDGPVTAPQVIAGEASASVARPLARVPLVLNKRNFDWVTNRISGAVENPTPRWWWVAFATTSAIAAFGLFCIAYQISTGVGVWGLNSPVGWAWDITNFVFWIGIGHAGTLISAILFLLRQKWRTSINRSAEAMTLFAVICAAIFPGIHVGRVWMAWFSRQFRRNTESGQTFAARCSGMSSRSRLTFRFPCSFGIPVWYLISRPCVIARLPRSGNSSTAFSRLAGGVRTATGAITRWHICSSPVSQPRSFFRCTASFPSTSPPLLFHPGNGDFPALFRRRRDLRRLRDGVDPDDSRARDFQTAGHHHAAAHRQDGEDHFAHRLVRCLCLCDGIFHFLV